ncbi:MULTISPECIES: hypothetical protein [Chryseobacterium]|uniref:Uncharacterized protein n=1 Tax=Chryseobacterium geocarposphaerae TaxID=1416776 RepID=A0ABU1LH57_9FLAO|nr:MULTISPECIES: hypothetical protein [Chryseobacterium]MDR6405885.1 hypothetical protein [Chryseobacterium geocarposphaerae]MDR6698951.1 hypothetical protein [Chryseobacterium ginsenosidimutans]
MKKRNLHKNKLKNRIKNVKKNKHFFDDFLKQEVYELEQNMDEGSDIFSGFEVPDFQFEDFDLNFDFTFDVDFNIDTDVDFSEIKGFELVEVAEPD